MLTQTSKQHQPTVNNGSKSWAREDFPSFQSKKILVLPGSNYAQTVRMFVEAGFSKALTAKEADVVCFLGGPDVSPKEYGQRPISEVSFCDSKRDENEKKIFNYCLKNGIVMVGICRGAQFLHVMNGGELWQHVNKHAGPHHNIVDLEEDVVVKSSSTHHQMMKYNDWMELLAVPDENVATIFKDEHIDINYEADPAPETAGDFSTEIEVEACTYSPCKTLCVQGHPEIGPRKFSSWFMYKLHDYFYEWETKNI